MSFSYSTPTSGPSAGGIGWFHFGNLAITPGDTLTGLTGTLKDGSTVTFDLSLTNISGQPRTFTASAAPASVDAFFGRTGYTNLTGNVSLYSDLNSVGSGVNTFIISNITLMDADNTPVPSFTVILADAETTNAGESWKYQTNGGAWQLLATLGDDLPTLTGIGTQTADIVGTQLSPPITQASYLLATQTPSQLIITATESAPGRQAISIGFATTRIRLQKYLAWRMDDSDQFLLDITGTPSGQATTAGNTSGFLPQTAQVYATPGDTYSMNESMASGSISQLSEYTTLVSAVNDTPAGSFLPTGSLPVSFTPALGDDVIYTIYNQIPYMYHKTVDMTHAETGDILTYTVFIPNPNPYPITDVHFIDATPAGTTYLGDLWVDKAYTGTDPASGLMVHSIPPNGSVTILWKVRINTAPPIPSPLVNIGYINIPSGNDGVTSFATTDIVTAHVTMHKAVSKAFAQPGEWLTYTLILHNSGNVVANNVTITDVLPPGVTWVPGSLTGAGGAFPTLTLNSPLAAGGTATVSYQVKISNTVPTPNPIANNALATFHYTVDPAHPGSKTGMAQSNTVTTLVQAATLSVTKNSNRSVSYVGDTITYQLAVKNTGNLPASNVVLTPALTAGTAYVPGSLSINVPATGDPAIGITLTNPIAPDETVSISFQVVVTAMPNPNPIQSQVTVVFTYPINAATIGGEAMNAQSNTVVIPVFRYNFGQQLNDLIHSVALEQAALASIVNAEGAKIQGMASMPDVTPDDLLCLNKSVADMMDSIATLETVLKQKLSIFDCQIVGSSC